MRLMTVSAVFGTSLDVDVCVACHVFWFDPFETLHLTPASTLELFAVIANARRSTGPLPLPRDLHCPKCGAWLRISHDRQGNMPFQYFSCSHGGGEAGHGRLMLFNDFLKEKKFVQPLSPDEITALKKRVRMINCTHCGAPVDLVKESICPHCASPISMLDPEAMERLASQYRAGATRPMPALPKPRLDARPHDGLIDFEALSRWLMSLLGR